MHQWKPTKDDNQNMFLFRKLFEAKLLNEILVFNAIMAPFSVSSLSMVDFLKARIFIAILTTTLTDLPSTPDEHS